jgi:uncharacterized repeat protein (TIGR04076 family)
MVDLIVKVEAIEGHCPVYQPGDEFVISEGYKLCAKGPICLHALASIMPYYVSLSRGVLPKDLGLGDERAAYVQCLDPCEYTGGGTVVFVIRRERMRDDQ